VVFREIEFAVVKVHMSNPFLLKGIIRRDICPVLTQIGLELQSLFFHF
jgi:hypothetical protein